MKLTATEVSRSGRTARTWNHETNTVELGATESLEFQFSLSSKGGGITDVKIAIGPQDFSALMSTMVSADRGRAMREMAAILATEVAQQAEHDKNLARVTRESVVEAADRAYSLAPDGRDHAERLARDVVRQLVDELNKSADSEAAMESDAA